MTEGKEALPNKRKMQDETDMPKLRLPKARASSSPTFQFRRRDDRFSAEVYLADRIPLEIRWLDRIPQQERVHLPGSEIVVFLPCPINAC